VGALRTGAGALGVAIDVTGAAAWGLAAFFLTNDLISSAGGGLLGVAIFFSASAYLLSGRMQESRAKALLADECPRCRAATRRDHEHRRWDTQGEGWLAPLTTWECVSCGYNHSEPVPCERCPDAA
jgi:hypothetical protein